MFPKYEAIKVMLEGIINEKQAQGHEIDGLYQKLNKLPNSYDALYEFASNLSKLPIRSDWPYIEPNDLDEIWEQCDPSRPLGLIVDNVDLHDSQKRVETAFYSSVCGCILGKPIEEFPFATLDDVKSSLEKVDKWPLNDYLSEKFLELYGRRNISWKECTKNHIKYVAPDDDITYTIIGMLLIEKNGINFSKEDIEDIWLNNLPINTTWGPERNILLKSGIASLVPECSYDMEEWVNVFNGGDERCGALIRADAYGYACPGRPALAAELAWKDASFTHRRTGIYGAMFIAAAIATAQVCNEPMEIFNTALKFVPQKSRFYRIVCDSINEISKAQNWIDGYYRIHNKYEQYSACCVYQEVGTLINTLKFAENISDGFCKQVCQGNDTDSFGATAGSILGAYFGPDYLDRRWIEVFNDDIYTTMSDFRERRLSKIAERMGQLPMRVITELENEC